jgi:hypothetical protein
MNLSVALIIMGAVDFLSDTEVVDLLGDCRLGFCQELHACLSMQLPADV